MATGSADIAAPCQGERLGVVAVVEEVAVVGGAAKGRGGGVALPPPPPPSSFCGALFLSPGLSIRIHLSDGSF